MTPEVLSCGCQMSSDGHWSYCVKHEPTQTQVTKIAYIDPSLPVPSPTDPRIAETSEALQRQLALVRQMQQQGPKAPILYPQDWRILERSIVDALSALQQRLEQVTKERDELADYKRGALAALALASSEVDEYPESLCPRCGKAQPDLDGFGVLHCAVCGYCSHPSLTGGVCGLCGHKVASSEGTERQP